jgi:F-type H+-transporting ATPase subunit delta
VPRGAVARRYAKALFGLAEEEGRVEAVRGELVALATLLGQSGELAAALLQPLHPAAQRRRVMAAVANRIGASPLLSSFTAYLIDQRRLVDVAAIRAEYEQLAEERAGRTCVAVRAARPLPEAQLDRLRRALSARVGRQVELAVEVDPSLLGGVVAKVGDLVFDGSLKTQLRHLRETLARE